MKKFGLGGEMRQGLASSTPPVLNMETEEDLKRKVAVMPLSTRYR